MTTDNQINHLRKLLADYYAGLASPAAIREIARLFSRLPSVPDDLLTDKLIIESEISLADALPEAPGSLDSVIESAIDSCSARSERRRHRSARIMIWCACGSAAAVIAILLSIGLRQNIPANAPASSPLPQLKSEEILASNPNDASTDPPAVSERPIATLDNKPADGQPPMIADAKPSPRNAARSVKRSNNHIVTDPREAAQCVENAFQLLESKLKASTQIHDDAISTLNKSNDRINEIISQSLQL